MGFLGLNKGCGNTHLLGKGMRSSMEQWVLAKQQTPARVAEIPRKNV